LVERKAPIRREGGGGKGRGSPYLYTEKERFGGKKGGLAPRVPNQGGEGEGGDRRPAEQRGGKGKDLVGCRRAAKGDAGVPTLQRKKKREKRARRLFGGGERKSEGKKRK